MSNLSIIQITLEIWGALFCLICGIIVFLGRKIETQRSRLLMFAMFTETIQLISDAFAWIFRGNITLIGYHMVRISNFSVFFANYVIGIFFAMYVATIIKSNGKKVNIKWIYSISFFSIIGIVLLVVSQFNNLLYYFDENNFYHRSDYYWLNMVCILVIILITFAMLIKYKSYIKRADFISLVIYVISPVFVIIVQFLIYGISLSNLANTMTMILLFMIHEIEKSSRIAQQEIQVAQQKAELADAKRNILMSQIQPHFISNTLLTIQGLYNEDSEKADEIMNSFIHFLQQSFSYISSNVPIHVSRELEHTYNYTNIIKERWPDMSVEYDVKCNCFMIPPLTIQPIVENAVRHGLMPLEKGGKIKISVFEDEKNYMITIEDNGVGFDINNPNPEYHDNRAHIGIPNIRERLEAMCGGTLNIESEKGKGTTVFIKILKER